MTSPPVRGFCRLNTLSLGRHMRWLPGREYLPDLVDALTRARV